MHPYHPTPAWLFIIIVLGYLALSLLIGGKKVFFDPFKEAPEEPEAAHKTEG
jgi:hypothetical protein